MSPSTAIADRGRPKTRAFNTIVAQIRAGIFDRRLSPGDRLPPEDALADQFGVSRTVVREALRVLELQGLVVVRHGYGGGAFVAEASSSPVSTALETMLRLEMVEPGELHEARLMMEPAVVRSAGSKLDAEHLSRLEDNVQQAEAALTSPTGAFSQNLEFHGLLAASSKNPIFGLVMQAVIEALVRLDYRYTSDAAAAAKIVAEHRGILEALRQGAVDLAAELMVEHLQHLAARAPDSELPGFGPAAREPAAAIAADAEAGPPRPVAAVPSSVERG